MTVEIWTLYLYVDQHGKLPLIHSVGRTELEQAAYEAKNQQYALDYTWLIKDLNWK